MIARLSVQRHFSLTTRNFKVWLIRKDSNLCGVNFQNLMFWDRLHTEIYIYGGNFTIGCGYF